MIYCGVCAQTLTFTVKVLPADQASIKYSGGAASAAVGQAAQGVGTPLATAVAAGGQLSDVVVFIDANSQALQKPAAAEWGWGGWFNGGDSGYNSWGWGGNNGGW
jgi:hypothetical protein